MSLVAKTSRLARQPWTILFSTVAFLLLSLLLWRAHVSKRLDNRLQEIRAAGLPASGAEITKWIPTPVPSKNGAMAMKDAYFRLQSFSSGKNSLDLSKLLETNWWAPGRILPLRRHVETNQVALEKLSAALEFPEFGYVKDYSPGPAVLLPHLAKLKESAYLLAADAALKIEDGSEAHFLRDIQAIIRIAETLDSEPILVSWMVRCSIVQIAVDSTRRALNRKSISKASCLRLEKEFARVVSSNFLSKALIGERALLLPVFRSHPSEIISLVDSSPTAVETFRFKLIAALGALELDAIDYIDVMDQAILTASGSPPASLALTNQISADALAARNAKTFTKMFASSFHRVTVRDATFRAHVALVLSALALERFRLEQGAAPETLQELVPKYLPAPPLDPFNGEPVGYKKKDPGYVVHSVGEDGSDDGGVARPTSGSSRAQASFDLTFEVNR